MDFGSLPMSSEEALDVKDVVVYGCGAIGSVLATFLQLSNKDREKTIHLVGRDYVLKPIRENGLIYKPFDENKPAIKTEGFKLYENIEDVPRTDVLFVSMKVHGLRDALKSAQHLLKSQPYVFLTMNGLGLPEIVEKFVDPVKIVECVVNYPSKLEENIVKNDGGNSNFMVKDTPNPPVKKLINALFNPGTLDIRIKPKFRINQWRKAMMNIGMNGVSAISMLTVGQVLERKTLGAIIKKLI